MVCHSLCNALAMARTSCTCCHPLESGTLCFCSASETASATTDTKTIPKDYGTGKRAIIEPKVAYASVFSDEGTGSTLAGDGTWALPPEVYDKLKTEQESTAAAKIQSVSVPARLGPCRVTISILFH